MRIPALLVTGMLASAAGPLVPQQATEVAVLFELRDGRFRNNFAGDTTRVENLIADSIAAALQTRIGFFRLVPGGNSEYALIFALDQREPRSDAWTPERGIWVGLRTPETSVPEFYWKQLRPAERALAPVGSDTALAAEVANLFRGDIDALNPLLHGIPISRDGLVWNQPLGWVLPFRRNELCMDYDTRLVFVNMVDHHNMHLRLADTATVAAPFQTDQPMDSLIKPYIDRAFSKPVHESAMDEDLRKGLTDRTAKVEAVYMVDYKWLPPCQPAAIPPNPPNGGHQ